MERVIKDVVALADGTKVDYTPLLSGVLRNISYIKDGTVAAFADTVDFNLTAEESGLDLWVQTNRTASQVVAPTQPAHNQAGGAVGAGVVAPIYLCGERVKISIAQAGALGQGRFVFVVG